MELFARSTDDTLYQLLFSYTSRSYAEESCLAVSELSASIQAANIDKRYALLTAKYSRGRTFLHRAAEDGHEKLIRCLLHNVTSHEQRVSLIRVANDDNFGQTALHKACLRGFSETVKCILDSITPESRHTLLIVQDKYGSTALHDASNEGHSETVKCILDSITLESRHTLLMVQDEEGSTALHAASWKGHSETVKCILDSITLESKHTLLRVQSKCERTPLHDASYKGRSETVKCILDSITLESRHTLLMVQDEEGNTALHAASWKGHSETVKCILDSITLESKHTLLRVQSKCERTPLHDASYKGCSETVKCILDSITLESRHTLLRVQDEAGNTALHFASRAGHSETVKCILDSIIPESRHTLLMVQDEYGDTALHDASRAGFLETVKCILDSITPESRHTLLMVQNKQGLTALHNASMKCSSKAIIVILESQTQEHRHLLLRMQDDKGKTALHCAACLRSEETTPNTVESMLQCLNTDYRTKLLSIQDNEGRTVIDELISVHRNNITTMLHPCISSAIELQAISERAVEVNRQSRSHDLINYDNIEDIFTQPEPISSHLPLSNEQTFDNSVATTSSCSEYQPTNVFTTPTSVSDHNPSIPDTIGYENNQHVTSALPANNGVLSRQPYQALSHKATTNQLTFPAQMTHNQPQLILPNANHPPTCTSGFTSPSTFQNTPSLSTSNSLYHLYNQTSELSAFRPPHTTTTSQATQASSLYPLNTMTPAASHTLPFPLFSDIGITLPASYPNFTNHLQTPSTLDAIHAPVSSNHGTSMIAYNPTHSGVSESGHSATSYVTGRKRDAPIDLSNQQSESGTPLAKVGKYEGKVDGCKFKLNYKNKWYIFPFEPMDTVSVLSKQVQKVTGVPCVINDKDGAEYTEDVKLRLVSTPFHMFIGDVKVIVSGNRKSDGKSGEPSTSGNRTDIEEGAHNGPGRFGRVVNARQVIELLTFVHEQVLCGKTVNAALKLANKDRKTIDRFKNIYYLHVQDNDRLQELETEWRNNGKKRALPGLDEMARKEINWERLEDLAAQDKLTLYGGLGK